MKDFVFLAGDYRQKVNTLDLAIFGYPLNNYTIIDKYTNKE